MRDKNKDILNMIFQKGPEYGTLKESVLAHAEVYGIKNIDTLFPDNKKVTDEPIIIKRRIEWVEHVLNNVYKLPFARIKTLYADIREDEARAKGYIKGNRKKDEVIPLLKRVTNPVTLYKKQTLDRDDLVDITEYNVITWLYSEMKLMLEEELSRAILVGDGRSQYNEDKINENNIRPIWTDYDLFCIKKNIIKTPSMTDSEIVDLFISSAIMARSEYRGSGNVTLFISPEFLSSMLLVKDKLGHRLYPNIAAISMELGVQNIVTVDIFNNLFRKDDLNKPYKILGIFVDLQDYAVGSDKMGEVTTFDDFDIDYNQQKYLIETRCSGALIKPLSAIAIDLKTANKDIEKIYVSKLPDKTIYLLDELFDPTGLEIKALHYDKTEEVITEYTIEGFDSSTLGTKTITVTYSKWSTTFEVRIVETPKVETDIEIEHLPTKLDYNIGEEFDKTGMKVNVIFDDGTKEEIHGYTIEGFDSSTAGVKTLTVKYKKFSTTFEVRIVETPKVETDIEIEHLPTKLDYNIGEEFDKTGMKVNVIFDDGTKEEIHGYTIEGFDSSTAGVKTLTVKYKKFSKTFEISIITPKRETDIEIAQLPTKLNYNIGEKFDKTGMKVNVIFIDGTKEEIHGYTIEGFDSSTLGTKTLTVKYKKFSTTFDVVIINPQRKKIGIEIAHLPTKLNYNIGEEFDKTGLKVNAVFDDGSKEEITDYTISGFDSSHEGIKTIDVKHETPSKTYFAFFEVEVTKAKTIKAIEVEHKPYKMEYIVGEKFDKTGMKVNIIYSDGSKDEDIQNYKVLDFDSSKVGKNTVQIRYDAYQTYFDVTIVDPKDIIGIEVATEPIKVIYKVDDDPIDITGLQVNAIRRDQSRYILTGYSISGFDTSAPGNKSVTIKFQNFTTSFAIDVVKKDVAIKELKIIQKPNKTSYDLNEPYDERGLRVAIVYEDDSQAEVYKYKITGFDSSTVGEKDITLSFLNVSTSYRYTVEKKVIVNIESWIGPYKKSYFRGEKLNVNGLSLRITYSNGTKALIDRFGSDTTFSELDSSTPGIKTITATYRGHSCTFTVDVIMDKTATGIEITRLPDKLVYFVNEDLDMTGSIIRLIYATGEKLPISDYGTFCDTTKAMEKKDALVIYKDHTVPDRKFGQSFFVTIKNRESSKRKGGGLV